MSYSKDQASTYHKGGSFFDRLWKFKPTDNKASKLSDLLSGLMQIRVIWTDLNNKKRCKSVSSKFILKNNEFDMYITAVNSCTSFPVTEDVVIKGSLPSEDSGEIWIYLDWDTLTVLPYLHKTGQVFGRIFQTKKNIDTTLQQRSMVKDIIEPWLMDPRQVLCKSLEILHEKYQLELKGSFEEEFYLFPLNEWRDKGILKPLDSSTFASTSSLDIHHDVLTKICEALELQNVPIEQILSESGPGQFEITIPYTDILVACDRHEIIHQTIKAVALQNGFIACFLPKIFENTPGNGCHAHLSLWRGDKNIMPDRSNPNGSGFSDEGCRFIGGLLHHAKSLTAIFNPTANSYRRLQPNTFSGGFIAWGIDNKESFIRVPSNPTSMDSGNTNFEVKTIDHTSNPYLVMAAIIYSGIHGLEETNKTIKLPELTPKNPALFTVEEREKLNIGDLPASLESALEFLKSDTSLENSIGKDILNSFYHVKTYDLQKFKLLKVEEEVKRLIDFY